MLNPAHILETAFLLLAAFLVGATVGSLAKLAFLRLAGSKPVPAHVSIPAPPQPASEGVALVDAPVIAPLNRPAQPTAPVDVPTPDFSEVAKSIAAGTDATPVLAEVRMPKLAALPLIEASTPAAMAPAREAGKSTSGRQVASPRPAQPRANPIEAGPSAAIIPFPVERATVSVDDEMASAQATPVEAVPIDEEAPQSAPIVVETASAEPETAEVLAEAIEPTPVATPDAAVTAPEPAPAEPPAAELEPAIEDETAAMRAIEGASAPRRARVRRTSASAPEAVATPAPEPHAIELPGRPVGIDAPRGDLKDNLTNIIGVLPVIESSLNSIGIYHFDQVSAFTDENVAWLEAYLGIPGRVDREHWREQARELAVISDRARKVAGQ